jgi:hypothetical protein
MIAIPKNPTDAKALRDFYTNVRTQMCSLGDQLGEPWKSHYDQIKGQYDTLLAQLGASDQVPAALDANAQLSALYSMLVSASSLSNLLSSQMLAMKQTSATQLNSAVEAAIAEKLTKGELVKSDAVTAKIQEAITTKTTSGELVPREQHTQLCSAAKTTGLEEGRAALLNEQKAETEKKQLIETRKTALQTAGLPVPEKDLEKLLGGTPEEFEAAKTKVQGRITALKTKSAYHSAFDRFMWASDADYGAFELLAADMKKATGPEPFQQRNNPPAAPAATTFAA